MIPNPTNLSGVFVIFNVLIDANEEVSTTEQNSFTDHKHEEETAMNKDLFVHSWG